MIDLVAHMSERIRTREFSIDDYDAAVELWKRTEGIEIAEGDDKESVVQFLKRNPGLSRTAIDGSTVIGVSLCGHDGRRGHIYHLAVDPKYQGLGLGKRLVEECFARLRQMGIQRAIMRTRFLAPQRLGRTAGRNGDGQRRADRRAKSKARSLKLDLAE